MTQILIAGFGGQGILFTGKFIACAGMLSGKEVSWFPSYGPEMRGGTTNCGVIVSKTQIGSPVVVHPDIILCLNGPSLDKFESRLAPDGKIFIDSSLTQKKVQDGINAFYIPATKLALENGLEGLGNMIILGNMLRECGICDRATAEASMKECVSSRRQEMIISNLKALDIGLAL